MNIPDYTMANSGLLALNIAIYMGRSRLCPLCTQLCMQGAIAYTCEPSLFFLESEKPSRILSSA
jgi:hypothetical protein